MARAGNTVYVTVAISREEKRKLDAAAKRAGTVRNRFVRNWIATLEDDDSE